MATSRGKQLAELIELKFRLVADFVAELTEEQLARTAHITEMKDSPLGEYPTLDGMINVLGEYQIQFHIDHLSEILAALAG
jgi:hypothetical protein